MATTNPRWRDFAPVFADALAHCDEVMGEAQITYDYETDDFGWGSSLTPSSSGEVVVLDNVYPGDFLHGERQADDGQPWSDDPAALEEQLLASMTQEWPDLWRVILDVIATNLSEDTNPTTE